MVLHLDLKPENIVVELSEDQRLINRLVFIDLGGIIPFEDLHDTDNQKWYQIISTPTITPPELVYYSLHRRELKKELPDMVDDYDLEVMSLGKISRLLSHDLEAAGYG